MDIMYAVLPHKKDIAITDLHGLHYQQYQIMKTKFIADTSEGIVFAALIENINRHVASVDMIQHPVIVKNTLAVALKRLLTVFLTTQNVNISENKTILQ